jgi:hypothetical protein
MAPRRLRNPLRGGVEQRLWQLALEMSSRRQPIDAMLQALRAAGASQMDTVKILREIEGLTLGQAKLAVDESETWQDLQASNEQLRDIAEESLDLPVENENSR